MKCLTVAAALGAGILLAACGGGMGDEADTRLAAAGVPQTLQQQRDVLPRQATTGGSATVDAAAYMDWAQTQYPGNFPGAQPTVPRSGFVFRYYPASGNFIIVSNAGDVYQLGPLTQGQLVRVGALADFACAVHTGSCTIPPAGVWVAYQGGVQIPVVFRFDGQGGYLMGQASGSTPGIERGSISVDAQGHYTAVVAQDTNGSAGLSNRSPSELQNTMQLVGSDLVVSSAAGVEQFRFKRVANDNSILVGAWAVSSANSLATQHLVFFPDGHYMMLDPIGDTDTSHTPCGGPGIEYGTYTYDPASSMASITGVSVDTNGCAGFNEPRNGSLYGGPSGGLVVLSNNGNVLTSNGNTAYRVSN
jgi:hypothetical protein